MPKKHPDPSVGQLQNAVFGPEPGEAAIPVGAGFFAANPPTGAMTVGPSLVTQGLYIKTIPAPSGEASIRPLVGVGGDPNNPTYMWALGATTNKIGYTTDHGATFTAVIVNPSAQAILQIVITTNFMWVLTSAQTSLSGQLWRSPAPNSTGSNLAFSQTIFDLNGKVNGPGGAGGSGRANMAFLNACLAVQPDESRVYLGTYGAGNDSVGLGGPTDVSMAAGADMVYSASGGGGAFIGCAAGATCTITGAGPGGATLSTTIKAVYSNKKLRVADSASTSVSGATLNIPSQTYGAGTIPYGPSIYVSSNANGAIGSITFTEAKFWSFAKHIHAVRIIGGVPWVSLGDMPFPTIQDGTQPLSDVGLQAATDATATAWNQKLASNYFSLTPFAVINFFPITVGGQPFIVGEADGFLGAGPIFYPSQSNAVGTRNAVIPILPTDMPQVATMRCLSITPEGNLMWLGTGETGGVGPISTIMIAKAPFSAFTPPVVLESSTTNQFGAPIITDAITDGPYTWFGNMRITREKFSGQ